MPTSWHTYITSTLVLLDLRLCTEVGVSYCDIDRPFSLFLQNGYFKIARAWKYYIYAKANKLKGECVSLNQPASYLSTLLAIVVNKW